MLRVALRGVFARKLRAFLTALAVFLGVLLTDWLALRKSLEFGWINAGREVLALVSAYGFWTVAMRGSPCCSATRRNSATPYGVSFDSPM